MLIVQRKKSKIDYEKFETSLREYLNGEPILKIAKKYNLPYSTLRRYILNYIKENNIEDPNDYETFPYEGFECLEPGDTFSWFPGGTIFLFKRIESAPYGEKIWIVYKTKQKGKNHFYPEDLDLCEKK